MNSEIHELLGEIGKLIPALDEGQKEKLTAEFTRMFNYTPKIGVFGKSGAGKSTLCNTLFGQEIAPVSDTEACTRTPQDIFMDLGAGGQKLILVDCPGVAESEEKDKEYEQAYRNLLSGNVKDGGSLDLVLWLLNGSERAYGPDLAFYKKVIQPFVNQGLPFLIVVTQVDKIEPYREWDEPKHQPKQGSKQEANIHKKIEVIARDFGVLVERVIPISANEKYNIRKLVEVIVDILPDDKKTIILKSIGEEHQSVHAKEQATQGWFRNFLKFCKDNAIPIIQGMTVIGVTIAKLFFKKR